MRTTFPLAVVLVMGVMSLMFAGSGFNAAVGMDRAGGVGSDVAGTADDQGIFGGSNDLVSAKAGDNGLFGLVIGGGQLLIGFVTLGGLLPDTLTALGFPDWFARPVGDMTEILLTLGVVQWITGRFYR
jgi:hypothetical protein